MFCFASSFFLYISLSEFAWNFGKLTAEFFSLHVFQLYFLLLLTQSAVSTKPTTEQCLLLFFLQLFPFRSSIVKNENVTEKGMAKKSWKHFHTAHEQRRKPRVWERVRAARQSVSFVVVAWWTRARFSCRVGLLCCLHVVEATIYVDNLWLCLCVVFYAYLINSLQ